MMERIEKEFNMDRNVNEIERTRHVNETKMDEK
jgi:hypothetical protein